MRKKINHFVFRCGGFDIWDERHEGNYLPFRNVVYKYTSGVFPNSEISAVYLRAHKKFPEKIICQYLGTKDLGIAPFEPSNEFTLVSCSRVIPLKRVHLIFEIIQKLDFRVNWHHFGDGPELDALKAKVKAANPMHNIHLHGRQPNHAILDFYQSQTVHLFITTSSTEGLPVSIQEAISFGIPILATNVGGMREVVTEETGFLIEPDFDITEIANLITQYRHSEKTVWPFVKQSVNFG